MGKDFFFYRLYVYSNIMKIGLVMNVKLLKNLAFLGLLSFSVFPSFALSKIIPDGTIPYNMGVQLKGDTDGPEDLDRVQELGMKWVRRGFIWESIEREKGVYDFSQYDRFVNDCEKRGLKIIGCMAFSNKLYGHVKDEPARSAYADFAAELVKHYKGRNIIWEIWNEPNTMTFWGRHGKVGNSPQYAREYTDICIFPGILRGVADFPMTSPKCHRIRFVPYLPYNISPFIVFYQLSCKIGISRTSRFVFHMPVQFITKSHTANNFQTSLLTIVYKTIILTKIINTFFSFDRFPNKPSSYPLHT